MGGINFLVHCQLPAPIDRRRQRRTLLTSAELLQSLFGPKTCVYNACIVYIQDGGIDHEYHVNSATPKNTSGF